MGPHWTFSFFPSPKSCLRQFRRVRSFVWQVRVTMTSRFSFLANKKGENHQPTIIPCTADSVAIPAAFERIQSLPVKIFTMKFVLKVSSIVTQSSPSYPSFTHAGLRFRNIITQIHVMGWNIRVFLQKLIILIDYRLRHWCHCVETDVLNQTLVMFAHVKTKGGANRWRRARGAIIFVSFSEHVTKVKCDPPISRLLPYICSQLINLNVVSQDAISERFGRNNYWRRGAPVEQPGRCAVSSDRRRDCCLAWITEVAQLSQRRPP